MPLTESIESVLAAFVTFNPDIELLERALYSIGGQASETVIVDNGSSNVEEIHNMVSRLGVRLISLKENQGIAAAFNVAFCCAREKSYKWVITCDQDSVMPDQMVARLLDASKQYENAIDIGIVCPNFYNRSAQCPEYLDKTPRLLDCCISSGSLTLVSAWNEISGFDEEMFIDGVDFEFCDRLIDAGYKILLVPDVYMEHEIGSASLHSILGHKFLVFNHSPFRKFYIAQNIIYRDGKGRGGHAGISAYLKVAKQMILVIMYEKDKLSKLFKLFMGTLSGRKMLIKVMGSI